MVNTGCLQADMQFRIEYKSNQDRTSQSRQVNSRLVKQRQFKSGQVKLGQVLSLVRIEQLRKGHLDRHSTNDPKPQTGNVISCLTRNSIQRDERNVCDIQEKTFNTQWSEGREIMRLGATLPNQISACRSQFRDKKTYSH